MKTPPSLRRLRIAVIVVLGVLIVGTIGYMLLDHLSLIDALYTTIGMMSTEGMVMHPLSLAGRLFTIGIIVLGVGSLFYTFGVMMEYFIEGSFHEQIRRHFMEKKIARLRQHCLVCGFGRVGSQIVEELVATHLPFVVIDEKESNIATCVQRGYLALQGDATSDALLREAGVGQARCVLVATDNDAHNISVTLSARHLNNEVFIVARANRDETKAKLELAGANRIISPYAIAGHRMASLAIEPGVVELIETLTKSGGVEIDIEEVVVSPTSWLVGKTLGEAQTTLRSGAIIVALKEPRGLILNQRSEAQVQAGDTLIIVGTSDQLAAFQHHNTAHPSS
jgi:voltage-gated potassium channel